MSSEGLLSRVEERKSTTFLLSRTWVMPQVMTKLSLSNISSEPCKLIKVHEYHCPLVCTLSYEIFAELVKPDKDGYGALSCRHGCHSACTLLWF